VSLGCAVGCDGVWLCCWLCRLVAVFCSGVYHLAVALCSLAVLFGVFHLAVSLALSLAVSLAVA